MLASLQKEKLINEEISYRMECTLRSIIAKLHKLAHIRTQEGQAWRDGTKDEEIEAQRSFLRVPQLVNSHFCPAK